jgi:hypothetical protein
MDPSNPLLIQKKRTKQEFRRSIRIAVPKLRVCEKETINKQLDPILSADFYKLYINPLLDQLQNVNVGHRAHQTRRSGRLLRLGFNEIAQFLSKSGSFSHPVSLFKSVFFSPIIIFFFQYSHKRRFHVPEI